MADTLFVILKDAPDVDHALRVRAAELNKSKSAVAVIALREYLSKPSTVAANEPV